MVQHPDIDPSHQEYEHAEQKRQKLPHHLARGFVGFIKVGQFRWFELQCGRESNSRIGAGDRVSRYGSMSFCVSGHRQVFQDEIGHTDQIVTKQKSLWITI